VNETVKHEQLYFAKQTGDFEIFTAALLRLVVLGLLNFWTTAKASVT